MRRADLPSLDEDLKQVGLSHVANEPLKEIGFPEDLPAGPKQRFRFYEVTMGPAPEQQLRPLTPEAQQALQEMGLRLPTPEDPHVQVHALTREEIAQIRPPQPSFTALDFEVWDYLTRTKSYQPGQLVTAEEVEKTLRQVEGKDHPWRMATEMGMVPDMYYSTLVKFGEPVEPWGTVRLTGRAWEADVVQAATQLLNEHAQILRERVVHGEADRLAQEKAMILMDISFLEQVLDSKRQLREDQKARIAADLAALYHALGTGGPKPASVYVRQEERQEFLASLAEVKAKFFAALRRQDEVKVDPPEHFSS